ARHVFVGEGDQRQPIYRVSHITLGEALDYFRRLELQGAKAEIAARVVNEIRQRLKFLNDVGLNYLSLDRSADTLSGGEAQRMKLSLELSRRTSTPTLYVLDEPTTGLHFADVGVLLGVLGRLVEQGHSVVVIEHHLDVVAAADHLIELGPEGGEAGGTVVATGVPAEVAALTSGSPTAPYLRAVLEAGAAH
ncbi:MAG: hypothetical protein KC417_09075, partial [Myxococcales bacterium]|nr:hypothetical protein [Myxococcales bacterium]